MTGKASGTADPGALIDRYLPHYDFSETHQIEARASAESAYDAVRHMDLSRSRLVRLLFRLRGLPTAHMTWEGLERMRFFPLAEEPPREKVVGIAGRFWTLKGSLRWFTPEEFIAFSEPGWAKAAWSAWVEPDGDSVRIVTETRILCLDPGSRRKFGRYWRVIRPFSGLIRIEGLKTMKRDAEARGVRS